MVSVDVKYHVYLVTGFMMPATRPVCTCVQINPTRSDSIFCNGINPLDVYDDVG